VIGPSQLSHPFSNATISKMIDQIVGTEGLSKELKESLAVVKANRMFDCPRYNDCLLIAAKDSWRGFTCRQCESFIPSSK